MDEKLRNEWESNPGVRAEFNHDYETFQCFREASDAGNVRILGGGARRKLLRAAEPGSPDFASTILRQWRNSSELRDEFGDDLGAFIEYAENEHRVTVLTGPSGGDCA